MGNKYNTKIEKPMQYKKNRQNSCTPYCHVVDIFGDGFGDEFDTKFDDEFGESPNWVMHLSPYLVINFVIHQIW